MALQCLRYTPTLEQAIISDLLSYPATVPQEPNALSAPLPNGSDAAPSFERLSANQELQSVPESAPMHDIALAGPPLSSTLNAYGETSNVGSVSSEPDSSFGALPQRSTHSMVPDFQGQHQLDIGYQQHSTQPVGIPHSQHGVPSHSRSSSVEQLQGESSGQLSEKLPSSGASGGSAHTVSIAGSPAGLRADSNSSTAEASAEGDDSAKAPPNASTIAKQPQPVSVPRVPLKRGEIADSFKTLVKQVACFSTNTLQALTHACTQLGTDNMRPITVYYDKPSLRGLSSVARSSLNTCHACEAALRAAPCLEYDHKLTSLQAPSFLRWDL